MATCFYCQRDISGGRYVVAQVWRLADRSEGVVPLATAERFHGSTKDGCLKRFTDGGGRRLNDSTKTIYEVGATDNVNDDAADDRLAPWGG